MLQTQLNRSPANLPQRSSPLFLSCFLVSALIFGLMFLHTSTPAAYLGRYSLGWLINIGITLLLTVVFGSLYLLALRNRLPVLHLPNSPRFAWVVTLAISLSAALFWRFYGSWNTTGPAIFRIYIVGLIALIDFGFLARSGALSRLLPARWFWLTLVAIVIAVLGLTARYVGVVPTMQWLDEPDDVNLSWTFYKTGIMTIAMTNYTVSDSMRHAVLFEPMVKLLTGYWMGLVGADFRNVRLFYMLFAWAAVGLSALTARHLYGNAAGLAAFAIGAFLPLQQVYARSDSFVAMMVAAALYLFFTARSKPSIWRHYLVGLCVGLAIEGHPIAVFYSIGFGAVYGLDYIRLLVQHRRWTWNPAFWSFAFGGITAAGIYVVLHFVLPSGGFSDLNQISSVYSAQTKVGGQFDFLHRILNSADLLPEYYLVSSAVAAILLLAGIIGLLLRRRTADWYLIALFGFSLAVQLVIMAHVSYYYMIYLLPFTAITGGAFVAQITGSLNEKEGKGQPLNVGLAAAIIFISGLQISHTFLLTTSTQGNNDFISVGRAVDKIIPADMPLAGWDAYYLGMPTRLNFFASDNFLSGKAPETWGAPLPQAMLLTRGLDYQFVTMQQYITDHHLVKAYCFPMSIFGEEAILYTPSALVPPNGPQNCQPDNLVAQ